MRGELLLDWPLCCFPAPEPAPSLIPRQRQQIQAQRSADGGANGIRIGFSEGFVLAFSGQEVEDASGTAIDAGAATLDPKDNKVLIAPLKAKLAPGTYTVKWHAVGTDTHHVTGHYTFQVKM